MAQNITASINTSMSIVEQLTLGVTTAPFTISQLPVYSFTNGITTGAVDLHYEDSGRVLASSASQTYTLSALTDSLGRSVAFVTVRFLMIYITSRAAGDWLTVGNAASHAWTAILGGTTPTYPVWDLDMKIATKTDGFAVVSGSSDQLKVLNSGANAITYNLYAIGTHA